MKFTWAIIGPGNIAKDFFYDLQFVKAKQCTLGAIYGHILQHSEDFIHECQAGFAVKSVAELIASKPDAVYIATPHPLHFEQAVECLQNKIPVLCEKPLAMNEEQVTQMIEASISNKTFLMEAMWTMLLPSTLHVRSLIQNNVIGDVLHISANMSYVEERDTKNRFFNPKLGGGSLLDMGVYTIYLSHMLMGFPVEIKSAGIINADNIDEVCNITLGYNKGRFAQLTSSIITKMPNEAFIYGTKGFIHISEPWTEKPASIKHKIYKEDNVETYIPEWEGKGFHFEIDETIQCIEAGKIESAALSFDVSKEVVKIMDEVRKQLHVFYKVADE